MWQGFGLKLFQVQGALPGRDLSLFTLAMIVLSRFISVTKTCNNLIINFAYLPTNPHAASIFKWISWLLSGLARPPALSARPLRVHPTHRARRSLSDGPRLPTSPHISGRAKSESLCTPNTMFTSMILDVVYCRVHMSFPCKGCNSSSNCFRPMRCNLHVVGCIELFLNQAHFWGVMNGYPKCPLFFYLY